MSRRSVNCPSQIRYFTFLLLIFCCFSPIDSRAQTRTCDGTLDTNAALIGPDSIAFKGKTVHANGSSTWTYCLTKKGQRDISHWAIGNLDAYLDCMEEADIIAADADECIVISTICDPTSGICGVKYDCQITSCECFSFTLNQNFEVGVITIATKPGNEVFTTLIDGPDCLAPLPVDLASFTSFVQNGQIRLNWTTQSEVNNMGFEIERSANAREWTSLDFIKGTANTLSEQHYEYLDKQPLPNLNYYRLKQIDFDGRYEYSDVRVAVIQEKAKIFSSVFPNPTYQHFTLQVHNPYQKSAFIKIYDTQGSIVWQASFPESTMPIYWTKEFDFNPGQVYFVATKIGKEQLFEKVFVQAE